MEPPLVSATMSPHEGEIRHEPLHTGYGGEFAGDGIARELARPNDIDRQRPAVRNVLAGDSNGEDEPHPDIMSDAAYEVRRGPSAEADG